MRSGLECVLAAGAVVTLLGCEPKSVPADDEPNAPPAAAIAGSGGVAAPPRAATGGQSAPALAAGRTPLAGAPAAMITTPAIAQPAPAAMPVMASADGPSIALARLDPFAAMTSTAAMAMPVAGAAGRASDRGMRERDRNMPSPELCERLLAMNANNARIRALLEACQTTPASGAAGTAAIGGSGGSTGDVSDAREPGELVGTAIFAHEAEGVVLVVVLDGCKDGAFYPVRIHDGHSCGDRAGIGERWDQTRGEDIPDLHCQNAHASQEYVRSHQAAKNWSLGGAAASDVIGHTVVIGDPDDRSLPVACGVVVTP